ncbi:MAG: class I SAM-dependent methyltransferase [Kofleriaceae bacterium]
MDERDDPELEEASAARQMAWFHERHAGVTRRALARGRDALGRSSYELLAELASPGEAALELGCGDGPLLELLVARGAAVVGIDRAAAELARARGAGAVRVRADAGALPFRAGSFALVLSHLAFSVMEDAPAIVEEVARVLAPRGVFAAIVGGGPAVRPGETDDAFELFLELLSASLRGRRRCRFGDVRAGRLDGWRELWGPRGFVVEGARHEIDLSGGVEEVWATLSSAYDCMLLAPAHLAALRGAFTARCATRFPDGAIPLRMVVWRLVARRTPA